MARRLVRGIDPSIRVRDIHGDLADRAVAAELIDCDYLFLATDTHTARLVANAIAQSFLIPLTQVGAKVDQRADESIETIYTAVRPVLPRRGCLACAGLIDPAALQREAATPEERANQDYLGTGEIIDPSVTTLNAAATAGALNAFLLAETGLADDELAEHRITRTTDAETLITRVTVDEACRWCGTHERSRYARADLDRLPLRPATQAKTRIRLLARLRRRGTR